MGGPLIAILETAGRCLRSVAAGCEARGGGGDCVAQARCWASPGSPATLFRVMAVPGTRDLPPALDVPGYE